MGSTHRHWSGMLQKSTCHRAVKPSPCRPTHLKAWAILHGTRSTEYLKKASKFTPNTYFEYPWNNAVSIGGLVTGMEYPGMTFNDYREKKAGLWFLISHEIGHNWYPMIVGIK